MIPVAMALKDEAVFAGSGKLPQRPLSPLMEEMERHGCSFEMLAAAKGAAGALNSVSYTHLDVYKRQLLGSILN